MPNNMPSKEEEIIIANMKKQMQLMSTQLQRMKEEEERSSDKFSFRDYFPSYNVESKPSQNNLQTPKKFRNIFEEKPWEPKPKRDFTPLGRSYKSTLEELIQKKLIVLPKVTLAGVSFLSDYCSYHRHNLHKTSHCKELKNKIQDLFDNGIIQKSKLSSTRDSTLKKDQHHETKSSNGLNVTLTSSNMPSPSKASKASNLSNIPPPKKSTQFFFY